MYGAEQNRTPIARRRYWWKKYQTRIEPSRLVFIDETWTKTNMAPLRGWGAKGKRLRAYVPQGLSGILCAGPVDIYWPKKRSPNMTANWTRASFHSRSARFQSAAA